MQHYKFYRNAILRPNIKGIHIYQWRSDWRISTWESRCALWLIFILLLDRSMTKSPRKSRASNPEGCRSGVAEQPGIYGGDYGIWCEEMSWKRAVYWCTCVLYQLEDDSHLASRMPRHSWNSTVIRSQLWEELSKRRLKERKRTKKNIKKLKNVLQRKKTCANIRASF